MQNGVTNAQPPAAAHTPPPANLAANPGWLGKMTPSPWLTQKLILLAVVVGVGIGAFCWGRKQHAEASKESNGESGYGGRVVARLYNDTVPVTREELGEYLIARFGAERLEFMLNRKIVEMECAKSGITCSNSEVEERLLHEVRILNPTLTVQDFANNILRRWGKTLYEYKEDVIRPKILMERLVRANVKITEKDVRDGFEARFGPKVECRMIVFEKGQASIAQKVWEVARKSRDEFIKEARIQFIKSLADAEGKVPPIHKHFGDKTIEETAFRLQPGQVSSVLEMKDGTYVILLCEAHLPASLTTRYEQVSEELKREVFEMRVAQRIPEAFAEMRKKATPYVVLDNTGTPSSNVMAPQTQQVGTEIERIKPSNRPVPPAPKGAPVLDTKSMPKLPDLPKVDPSKMDLRVPPPTAPLTSGTVGQPEKK